MLIELSLGRVEENISDDDNGSKHNVIFGMMGKKTLLEHYTQKWGNILTSILRLLIVSTSAAPSLKSCGLQK